MIGMAEGEASLHDAKESRDLLIAKGRSHQMRLYPITHRMSSALTGQGSIVVFPPSLLQCTNIFLLVSLSLQLPFSLCHRARKTKKISDWAGGEIVVRLCLYDSHFGGGRCVGYLLFLVLHLLLLRCWVLTEEGTRSRWSLYIDFYLLYLLVLRGCDTMGKATRL